MGDFNTRSNDDGLDKVMGKCSRDLDMNQDGKWLVEICNMNSLVIGGTVFPHKEIHKVIWNSPRLYYKEPDRSLLHFSNVLQLIGRGTCVQGSRRGQ